MIRRSSAPALLFVAALAAFPVRARADEPPDRAACRAAYEQGQRLRRGKKLIESREKLLLCARDPCPAVFQPECAKWLGELDAEVPTVVVAVEEATLAGSAPRVLVDGAPFAPHVDGIARPIDPGPHEFVVENEHARIVQKVTIVEGEKAQRVVLVGPDAPPRREAPAKSKRIPPLAIGLGALGVVALGTSAFFGIRGLGQKRDIDRCSPDCSLDDVHAARRTFLYSDIALGTGVLALGAAVVLWVTRPDEAPAAAAAALSPLSF